MMASYKHLWQAVLTVYMTFCIPAMASEGQHELSVSVTTTRMQQADYNFNGLMFDRFYECMRNTGYLICDAVKDNNGNVHTVRGCLDRGIFRNPDGFTCKATSGGIACKRGDSPPVDTGCLKTYPIDHGAVLSLQIQMTWAGVDKVTMNSKRPDITISNLPNYTFVVQSTTSSVQPTVMTTPRITTQAGGRTQTPSPPDSSNTGPTKGSLGTGMQKSDDGDDNNNLAVIIGAAAGGVVVIVIIVIIFWRCKRRTSSSPTSNNKEYEDTDIYPYGDSILSNIEPNSNGINTSPNPEEPVPDMYAAVDPNKKPNKTKTSSGTKNADENNKNKSQQKKTRFTQSLDYTEVDIDNDADHYQSSSDVHDGNGVVNRVTISPSAPSNPSAKPSYYNIRTETGEEPSAMYSQVVKTNKNKGLSAINGDGAGSNPARDSSGYEEAKPHIETQSTTVDPSANNTTTPAPDGVYAKLHDPVRNITDVYNE